MSCSQKDRAVLPLQPKLKACRVASPNIHNHKLNTSNLEVHTLTMYQYIVHKQISLLYSSHVTLPISPPSIFLIWLRTRIIGNKTFQLLKLQNISVIYKYFNHIWSEQLLYGDWSLDISKVRSAFIFSYQAVLERSSVWRIDPSDVCTTGLRNFGKSTRHNIIKILNFQ
jgi:hypothetical protein